MDKELAGWMVSAVALITLMFVLEALNSYENEKLISDCEKNLPRTQHCKLVAVVDMDGGK